MKNRSEEFTISNTLRMEGRNLVTSCTQIALGTRLWRTMKLLYNSKTWCLTKQIEKELSGKRYPGQNVIKIDPFSQSERNNKFCDWTDAQAEKKKDKNENNLDRRKQLITNDKLCDKMSRVLSNCSTGRSTKVK